MGQIIYCYWPTLKKTIGPTGKVLVNLRKYITLDEGLTWERHRCRQILPPEPKLLEHSLRQPRGKIICLLHA